MSHASYAEWLRRWRRRRASRRCFEACREGVAMFSELRAVVGLSARVRNPVDLWDFIGVHCWLSTPGGEIIDPTAHQYDVSRDELGMPNE